MLIQRLAIIGVGLIGGSLARALRQKRQCRSVIGFGRNTGRLEKAVALGVIDEYSLTVASAVRDADMVVLATPLNTTAALLHSMHNYLGKETIITDVGSAKGSVVDAARKSLGDHMPRFVPGHPIAGRETSGVEASVPDLFESHRVILTPLPENSVQALEQVTKMWEITGAEVVHMDVEQHDNILAATSHLPHMLAYALVDCLAGMKNNEDIFRFAAGGFADFTRIASSDPQMWHDICIANRQHLLEALGHFDRYLDQIRLAIEKDDSKALLEIFTRAKTARDQFTRARNRHNEVPE